VDKNVDIPSTFSATKVKRFCFVTGNTLSLWKSMIFDVKKNFENRKKVKKGAPFERKNRKKHVRTATFSENLPRFSEKVYSLTMSSTAFLNAEGLIAGYLYRFGSIARNSFDSFVRSIKPLSNIDLTSGKY
jgi:hypothetical protein